ncbi:hypothetical protein [Streptomyces sp. JH34]|uniref:hypothetical protein n=1 Tax=Streptomyces sp. JH34 TaxID=2793633 RepID=UPI0023F7E015|nr:hypothetical protein [Streptomyces sp. JH34]MDF6023138.1 hypothetical protein [Streptomyces sp. JH34]
MFDVELAPEHLPAEWTEGPLPALLSDGSAADRDRRLTYFEPRVGESLFGTPARPSRWYLRHPGGADEPAVEAMELLRVPAAAGLRERDAGLCVLHVHLGDDPRTDLTALAALPTDHGRLAKLLPRGVRVAAGASRAWTLTHVTFPHGPPPAVMPAAYAAWETHDQWLWLLASRSPLERFAPDPEDTALFAGRVRFSADWQALVLRDGTAFVGLSPDPGGEGTFHATAAHHVHTIYLDVFLLGRLQHLGANSLANTVSALSAREADAHRLLRLEGRLIELRRALWSSHITSRGKANELLERFQEQHRLEQLLTHAGTGLAETARHVEAARSRRASVALALLSAVGLPFGVAYAAGALWGTPGPWTLLVATAVAVLLTAAAFASLPPLRGLVSDTVWDRAED